MLRRGSFPCRSIATLESCTVQKLTFFAPTGIGAQDVTLAFPYKS
jgi:hypothetical protein